MMKPPLLSGGRRRLLHEPLFPIDWTPPPPPPPLAFFIPPPPPAPVSSSSSAVASKTATVAASAAISALVLLSLSIFVFYRCRSKTPPSSPKLTTAAAGGGFGLRSRAPEVLYLGSVEPNYSAGSNGSPCRDVAGAAERSLEFYNPSPELRPLPPLPHPPSRAAAPPPPAVAPSSDDETFYTSRWTLGSGYSGSSSSPASRRSLPTSVPDVRQVVPPITEQPPPPPPPPPPPHPPALASLAALGRKETPLEPSSSLPSSPSTIGSSSRRRLRYPLPANNPATNFRLPDSFFSNENSAPSSRQADDANSAEKPRLKPLHWDKLRGTSDRATVWDQLQSSSSPLQLNEDMIETLFVNQSTTLPKGMVQRSLVRQFNLDNRVLDPKRAQNIAILLRALDLTREEVAEALLDGNLDMLGIEHLETLVKMAPTKEEELQLCNYSGDLSRLDSAESFLKAVLDVPFAFRRVDAMLYRANFGGEISYLRKSFETLEAACDDLRSSKLFLKLLEAVLKTGNRMNVGTNRGQAEAFKLDALLKLGDVKGTDGRTTLLHFVVQEIIRSEGSGSDHTIGEEQFKKQGLKVAAELSSELTSVRKAAGMDSDMLRSYVLKLETGIERVESTVQLEMACGQGEKFFETMKVFLGEARREIYKVKEEQKAVLGHVKEITEYFHGDAAKEEADPLRIFVVVRDFISMLDHACKDAGRMPERTMVGSGKPFRESLPIHRYKWQRDANPNEESRSSL